MLTISGIVPSLEFKRHPECIFLSLLRFMAPFGLPLGGNFGTFSGIFRHAKKSMIFQRAGEGRRHRRRPQDSLRERLGPCAESYLRRLRQAKAWRGVYIQASPLPPAPLPSAGLLVSWLDLELILEVFRVSGAGFW